MVFTKNELHIINHRIGQMFPSIRTVFHVKYPVVNSIEGGTTPSGMCLVVRIPPIGRVWLMTAYDGFTLDDVIPEEWHNCLRYDDDRTEPLPEAIATIDAVVEWVAGIIGRTSDTV